MLMLSLALRNNNLQDSDARSKVPLAPESDVSRAAPSATTATGLANINELCS